MDIRVPWFHRRRRPISWPRWTTFRARSKSLTRTQRTAREVTVVVPTYRRRSTREMPCWAAVSDLSSIDGNRGEETWRRTHRELLSGHPTAQSTRRVGRTRWPDGGDGSCGGLVASRTPLVAFTDDDAIPRPDWIERLIEPFSNPAIGGVGGRDIIVADHLDSTKCSASEELVGIVTPWGRLIGNHHIGVGPVRYVDVLKGGHLDAPKPAIAVAIPRPARLWRPGA